MHFVLSRLFSDLYPRIGTKPRNEAFAHVSSGFVSLKGPNRERLQDMLRYDLGLYHDGLTKKIIILEMNMLLDLYRIEIGRASCRERVLRLV